MVEFTVRVTGESGGQLSDVQAFEVREGAEWSLAL
jgi:hypothetical protein